MTEYELTEDELQIKYADFLKDTSFQEFEMLSENPNIFEILKTQTYEIRHSNFLAWLLNPNANHGLGDRFLKMFLLDLAVDKKSDDFNVITVQNLDYSNVEIFREWQNIDIVLLFGDLVVAIENKIYHFETKGQLENYKEKIEQEFNVKHKVYVFLNPNGDDASHPDFISYSYETIAIYLEQILSLNKSLLSRTRIYLEDYLENLKNTLMGSGEKNALVNKIYSHHKDLIDFIIQNKSSELQKVRFQLEKLINERGWILGSSSKKYLRFLTADLDRIIPKNDPNRDWKEGEAFLFQVDFVDNKSEIITCCAISPCEISIRKNLLDILGDNNKGSGGWAIYNKTSHDLKDILNTVDCDYLLIAKEIMLSLEKMVKEIQPKLLENQNKFYLQA